ncbi:acyl-CoA carboxylase epsilon subunit [Nocardia concava]|uniref:acyl-CoA carboxylase epsilon subunit n=1 Tax=Nocardia concava TaxID=257281 RepID=UPI0002F6D91D|nr:acyl-CoA carboxylase epsilon subunit [Nocardia concava]
MTAPLIRIERGEPDDIETAALLIALVSVLVNSVESAAPAVAPVHWIGPPRVSAFVPPRSWAAA